MGKYYMNKDIYIPIVSIIIGELLVLHGNIYEGIIIHMIIILSIIIAIIFGNLSLEIKNALQSVMLLPILRIISLSIPQLFSNYLQYLLIYGIMIIPIFLVIKNQWTSHKDLGRNLSIPLVIIVMIIIGQYIKIFPNIQTFSLDVKYLIEEFMSISLIIILLISFLISNTKYYDKYVSKTIGIYSNPLLLAFATIVIHRLILQI